MPSASDESPVTTAIQLLVDPVDASGIIFYKSGVSVELPFPLCWFSGFKTELQLELMSALRILLLTVLGY